MPQDIAQDWVAFMFALQGRRNYFAFGSAFTAAYVGSLGSRNWRLKSNARKWSVSSMRYYGFAFEAIEAL
jgi:hypothetical protein